MNNTKLVLIIVLSFLALGLSAGVVDGYMWDEATIDKGEELEYKWTFKAGELASVYLEGDTTTDLDLFVYDMAGKLVASDEDDTDYCELEWTPAKTATYIIRIKNLGKLENNYYIESN